MKWDKYLRIACAFAVRIVNRTTEARVFRILNFKTIHIT